LRLNLNLYFVIEFNLEKKDFNYSKKRLNILYFWEKNELKGVNK